MMWYLTSSQPYLSGRERDAKITVYKKTDETYMLKMKNSREFFSQVICSADLTTLKLAVIFEYKKAISE
jgi:hypothetical protein